MGAKKLYEEEILRLVKKLPENEMASVVRYLSEKLNEPEIGNNVQRKINKDGVSDAIHLIEKGYWQNKLSHSDLFSIGKQAEKTLDL
jgi:uncharacterized protein (UPF0371 family)